MEVWLPNQQEAWDEAVALGQVVPLGRSLGEDWLSAFVIPAYLAEQHPGLESVEDLKKPEFNKLFVTPDSEGKARLVSCSVAWTCERVIAAQIEAYGLTDYVDVVIPGTFDELLADLEDKYSRKEPWLGYNYGTSPLALVLDLVRLEEPPFTEECWATTMACAFEDATILIGVHSSLEDKAPNLVEFLRNWDLNVERHRPIAKYINSNPDVDIRGIAIWYLKNYEPVWSEWVPASVAEKVRETLTDS